MGAPLGLTEDQVTILANGSVRIRQRRRQDITEHFCGIEERDTVFGDVCIGLVRIPLKIHGNSSDALKVYFRTLKLHHQETMGRGKTRQDPMLARQPYNQP